MNIPWFWLVSVVIVGAYVGNAIDARAQIIPDTTLPKNSSIIRDGNTFNIIGGTQAGQNLFHSFSEFSIPTGTQVLFNNGADIQNIISRVTGKSISNIDGLIQTNGTANLFLINPNGITFGQNATLKIGGSFLASTANNLKFADRKEFSTNSSQSTPLLTVSTPIGLQFGKNPGEIHVQGQSGFFNSIEGLGLRVDTGKTLSLVGGNIFINGNYLNALGGRIELASVVNDGLVNLNPTVQGWNLNYQGVQNYGDIQITRSFVDVAIFESNGVQIPSEDSAIAIRAAQLDISNSVILASTLTSIPGSDINIDVKRLLVRDGASVATATSFDIGTAGDIIVNASELVELGGLGSPFISVLSAGSEGLGKAGSITVNTARLVIRDGAQIEAATLSSGKGGNVIVNASELVQMIGESANGLSRSGLFASTLGEGDGGSLTINTPRLQILNGAQVTVGSTGSGKGGNATINASTSVELVGKSANGRFPSRLFAGTQSTGNGGNLEINTPELLARDGASIIVSATGKGSAGNLEINANSIRLDKQASLDANTTSINVNPNLPQATITLRAKDLILLGGSNITTNAQGQNVIGGNINIDTNILAALENSDINANSTDFRGGRVAIKAQGIIGTQFRDALTSKSDITATGANPQLNGTVQINTPDVDPSQGLVPLPEIVVDPAALITQNPCQKSIGSTFVAIGRGGLPANPTQALTTQAVRVSLVQPTSPTITQAQQQRNQYSHIAKKPGKTQDSIVEAQGWIINNKGEIILTAHSSTATQPQNLLQSPPSCPGS